MCAPEKEGDWASGTFQGGGERCRCYSPTGRPTSGRRRGNGGPFGLATQPLWEEKAGPPACGASWEDDRPQSQKLWRCGDNGKERCRRASCGGCIWEESTCRWILSGGIREEEMPPRIGAPVPGRRRGWARIGAANGRSAAPKPDVTCRMRPRRPRL